MRQIRQVAYLCSKMSGAIDISGPENPRDGISTSVNALDPEKCVDFEFTDEIIGTGDGSCLSLTLSDLAHGKNGVCSETLFLPTIYAICGGRKRGVIVDADGNCRGCCRAGQLDLSNGTWTTDITWIAAPDTGTDITITYYERFYSYSGIALIMPDKNTPGCKDEINKIGVKLLKEIDSVHLSDPGSDQLTWWRGEWPVTGYQDPEKEPEHNLHSWISFAFQNSENCHWVMTDVTVFGAGGEVFHGRSFVTIVVNSGGKACPEERDDVFGGGKTTFHSMIQNQIVPGERIRLEWLFWNTETQAKPLVDEKWFFTHCFTGGKVTSVNGDYGDVGITYTVELEGLEKECVPSDFVEYAVGDWVFVAKIGGMCDVCEERSGVCCSYAGTVEGYAGGELLLLLVNNARSSEGLDPLVLNDSLSLAARRHAEDMADNEFCSHTGSDGSGSQERIATTGYLAGEGPVGYGENVAKGYVSVRLVFNAWMNSAGHKANILQPLFKDMGFGHKVRVEEMSFEYDDEGNRIVTETKETDYWCQTFGYNDSPPPTPVSEYIILPMKIAEYGP